MSFDTFIRDRYKNPSQKCKNKCGKMRRYNSVYCQPCSDLNSLDYEVINEQ